MLRKSSKHNILALETNFIKMIFQFLLMCTSNFLKNPLGNDTLAVSLNQSNESITQNLDKNLASKNMQVPTNLTDIDAVQLQEKSDLIQDSKNKRLVVPEIEKISDSLEPEEIDMDTLFQDYDLPSWLTETTSLDDYEDLKLALSDGYTEASDLVKIVDKVNDKVKILNEPTKGVTEVGLAIETTSAVITTEVSTVDETTHQAMTSSLNMTSKLDTLATESTTTTELITTTPSKQVKSKLEVNQQTTPFKIESYDAVYELYEKREEDEVRLGQNETKQVNNLEVVEIVSTKLNATVLDAENTDFKNTTAHEPENNSELVKKLVSKTEDTMDQMGIKATSPNRVIFLQSDEITTTTAQIDISVDTTSTRHDKEDNYLNTTQISTTAKTKRRLVQKKRLTLFQTACIAVFCILCGAIVIWMINCYFQKKYTRGHTVREYNGV